MRTTASPVRGTDTDTDVAFGIHLDSLRQLPRGTFRPRIPIARPAGPALCDSIARLGVDAIESGATTRISPKVAADSGLSSYIGLTWNINPGDRRFPERVARAAAEGFTAVVVLIGSPVDSERKRNTAVEAVLDLEAEHRIPIVLETHRGTMTQEIGDTCALAVRYPELKFNLDYSHWWFAHELWRHDPDEVLDAISPILPGVHHLHLRVASPHEIQVPVLDAPHLEQFLHVWVEILRARTHSITAMAELLPPMFGYARTRASSSRLHESLALTRAIRDAIGVGR